MRVKEEVNILTGALSSHIRYISVSSSLNIIYLIEILINLAWILRICIS